MAKPVVDVKNVQKVYAKKEDNQSHALKGGYSPFKRGKTSISGTYLVIDVRNKLEWNEGHLPHAKHITLEHLTEHVQDIPKNRSIIVQCRSGIRSAITETWCKGSNKCTRWIFSMAKGGIPYL
ncbi:rhodanese-like domain-containing protein [Bacillus cereus]|uniref:rhodanese-like domain-containing protein n=1 Tax=Bacillus cereus TaxID=1396 RepID=UPI0009673DF6|nr:rhodanese-like domain-containing protein [Bacillus cereus]OLR27604.1 hypothetical protein BLD50_00740 [Bacillus cereus]